MNLQGTGMQNAIIIISAIIFSPPGSTICIEEPENFLHPRSQEVLVDLFNYASNKLDKQIIFSTQSYEMGMLPFISDIGKGSERDHNYEKGKSR
jgi:predicted ATP-dependent endonuclease of OLD family